MDQRARVLRLLAGAGGRPPVAIDAKGAGPVVVVGTTGDPATPLEGTRRTSEALEDGHLIVVTADQHTGYGVNDCVDSAVDDYLVELKVPPNELKCDGSATDSTDDTTGDSTAATGDLASR